MHCIKYFRALAREHMIKSDYAVAGSSVKYFDFGWLVMSIVSYDAFVAAYFQSFLTTAAELIIY